MWDKSLKNKIMNPKLFEPALSQTTMFITELFEIISQYSAEIKVIKFFDRLKDSDFERETHLIKSDTRYFVAKYKGVLFSVCCICDAISMSGIRNKLIDIEIIFNNQKS